MTPKQLEKIGKAMHPDWNWKSELAKDIGVARMTVLRWSNRDYPIPEGKVREIISAMEKRRDNLSVLIKTVKGKTDGKKKAKRGA